MEFPLGNFLCSWPIANLLGEVELAAFQGQYLPGLVSSLGLRESPVVKWPDFLCIATVA